MLKLQPTIDEAPVRVGNLQSLISDEGFSPPVHDRPLDISILYGRGAGPNQGRAERQSSEFSRIPLRGTPETAFPTEAARLDGTRRVPATLPSEFSRIPLREMPETAESSEFSRIPLREMPETAESSEFSRIPLRGTPETAESSEFSRIPLREMPETAESSEFSRIPLREMPETAESSEFSRIPLREMPETAESSEFSRIPLREMPETAFIDADQPSEAAPTTIKTASIEDTPPVRKVQLCSFDAVRPCDTSWIWPGRVATGWLTLLAGEAAAGKSMVLIDLASRASRGDTFPRGLVPGATQFGADAARDDEARADKEDLPIAKKVLLLTRAGTEGVVRPRLAAAGADMRHIQTLRDFPDTDEQGQPVTRGFDIEKDLAAVEETLADQPAIELVVIDGCALTLDSRHRGFSEASRATLRELQELARRRKVAIVVAVSIEGQAAGNGLRRWLDKLLAITEDSFVLALIRDRRRPARRFLLTLRATLASTEDGLRFETSGGRIVWGDAAVSAAALGASAGQLDQMDAALWLRQELAFYPRAVTALREAAQEAGFAWHVVCRAKAIAGVDGRREGWGPKGRYFWFLERDGQERAEDASFWEELADRPVNGTEWDYRAEPAYREEMARLSKLTNPMAVEPDFSAPSVVCPGSQESGAEQAESDGRAVVGEAPTEQKAAEITMENKKTPQAERERFRPITDDVA